MTRILAIGDIMGKAGRRALDRLLPELRDEFSPDIVTANGENAAGGFGLTQKIFDRLIGPMGIDCVTMGNHWHDKKEIHEYHDRSDQIVLPANMENVDRDDWGLTIRTAANGRRFAVINLIGRAFMKGDNRDYFAAADKLLGHVPSDVKIRIVDMHAEASSEKQGIGWYLAGRVSLVFGTHCHVPTADERLLDGQTGFCTDVGMTGAYDSIIGIRKDAALSRLRTGEKKKFEPATRDPWLCGLVADVDDETGHCRKIQRLRREIPDAN